MPVVAKPSISSYFAEWRERILRHREALCRVQVGTIHTDSRVNKVEKLGYGRVDADSL